MNTYKTIHTAYIETLRDIYNNYDYRASPRGLPVREKTDYMFRILNPIAEPIVTKDPERNVVIEDYTRKEVELYNSCTNQVVDFAKASKFWEKLANPDGTVNSAYGYLIWANKSHGNPYHELIEKLPNGVTKVPSSYSDEYRAAMRTPWEWAKQSLIDDKDSRQALLRFSLPEHQYRGNKDQTCTLNGLFLIREDRLNLSITMRSNDLWLGLTYDLPWFVSLMDKMIDELKPYYPNLTKGHYTHIVHSLHCYERDEEKIKKAIG
jgi:thymidylate synthase